MTTPMLPTTRSAMATIPMSANPSIAHRLAAPEHMAFSPSNMSPNTITSFTNSDSVGVPLHTSWTFWIDKYDWQIKNLIDSVICAGPLIKVQRPHNTKPIWRRSTLSPPCRASGPSTTTYPASPSCPWGLITTWCERRGSHCGRIPTSVTGAPGGSSAERETLPGSGKSCF